MRLENILLFEHSPEALEAVKSGNAVVRSGGIRKKGNGGGGFLELAKPAVLSVADFKSLFEGKEHALLTDERLNQLESQLSLSDAALAEIENTAWLNNVAIQRTYTLTYAGFQHTLHGLECVSKQLTDFEQYVYKRDKKQLAKETQKYINYLKTDYGLLRSKKYDVTNGNIAEHLDQMSAMIKTLMLDIKNDEEDSFAAVMILKHLLPPFTTVVRKYSALYYYENNCEMMPGALDEWINTISMVCNSRIFKEKLTYYINLKCTMPFKDKILLGNKIGISMKSLISNVKHDKEYICKHSKDEYLSIAEQVREKTKQQDYYILDGNVFIFLDDPKEQD